MTDSQRSILTGLGFIPTPKSQQPGTRLRSAKSGSAWENWELHKPGARTLYIGHRTNCVSQDGITEPYWANIFEMNRPPLRMHTFDDMLVAVVALCLDPNIRDVANCYIYEAP